MLPVVGIVASETLLFLGYTRYALWGHFVTLLLSVVLPLWATGYTDLIRGFALISCFRLVNLAMPVFVELTLLWFPLIYGPFMPVLYLIGRNQPSLSLSIRPVKTLLLLPVALVFGFVMGEVEYSILEPAALIPAWTPLDLGLITVVMIGFVALVEEALFRGVLQRTLKSHYGRWVGVLGASIIFGLMHSGYGLLPEIAFAGASGLVYGLAYEYTDSLGFVVLMHGLLNIFLFAVLPIQGPFIL